MRSSSKDLENVGVKVEIFVRYGNMSLSAIMRSVRLAFSHYRIAELEIQRDIGVLEVDEKGLWHEYEHGEK